jgi:hypothetical protein
MKVSFCVPSTTRNRDWKKIEDTYLWKILFTTLEKYTPNHDITVFVGYDESDHIYLNSEERLKPMAVFKNFKIDWVVFGPEYKGKLNLIWNNLADISIQRGFEYIKILGDDIRLPNDSDWLGCFINKLKKNNNIGFSAGYSNNDQIPTQFLIHRTHIEIFGWVYPPEIANWGVDNWLNDVYPEKYRIWLRSYPLLNVGGQPRYDIVFNERFVKSIVNRYKPKLNKFLSQK